MFSDIGKFKRYLGKRFLIVCQQDEKYAIDTCQNQKEGGEIIIWEASKTNANQLWTVDCMGHIMNAADPQCVIVARETKDEARLLVTGKNENGPEPYGVLARWTLTKEGEIVSQANPEARFNVCGAKMANKQPMIMWHKQGSDAKNDKWKIVTVGGFEVKETLPDIGGLKNFVDARFSIHCVSNDKFCVDSASKQRGGGDSLIWSWKNNANQIWTVDKYGHIINAENPGEMMALVPVRSAQGAHVAVTKLTNTGLMRAPIAGWTMNASGEIVSQGHPELILNVCGGVIKDGPALILWPRQKTDAKNDKWKLEKH